ncbi:MAG TPA: VWA domain-containing protein [Dehalococcoidia bacterium]|jgi:Ca-activated chloride channel family protein|nr:VWA domain-containing protein [Dehalococcoidia bacterium]
MSFEWPWALLLLVIVPILAGLYVWMQTQRRQYALRYASVSLVQQAVGSGPGRKRHVPAVLYLLAMTALIIGLGRPQATIPVPSNTGTIILSIDVSGSMFAEDVEPNRMEATKAAAREFVEKQPEGVKIGVVSFSDFGALVAPPNEDRKQALEAISRLRPQRGTNIGAGLQVALEAIYEDQADGDPVVTNDPVPTPTLADLDVPPASIVLVSDGQSNTGPDPIDIATEAQKAGVKVYTVGIGTEEGTVLQIQGRNVFTRLDETTLVGMAELTGGRYFNAQDEGDLHAIYDDLSRERVLEDKETEVTFVFAAVALVLSALAGGLGLVWFNRLP